MSQLYRSWNRHIAGRLALRGVLVTVIAMAASACGGGSSGQTDGDKEGKSESGASASLPEEIRKKGSISVVSSWNYPPFVFQEADKSYHGLEVDMLDLVGEKLGVEMKYEFSEGFATLVPSVASGRYDMATGAIGVLDERLTTVGFVEWVRLTNGLVVLAGNPKGVNSQELCGRSVSVETGTAEIDTYGKLSEECKSAGDPPIDVKIFPSEAALLLAVQSGRVDAAALGTAVAEYKVKASDGRLEVAPGGEVAPDQQLPTGFVFEKNNTKLGQAVYEALKALQDEGKVTEVLTKWGIASEELPVRLVVGTN